MRVAIFTDTYYQVNGVSMVYNRFARWCVTRGYEIEIFTPGNEEPQTKAGVKIHSIPMLAPFPYYRGLYFDLLPLRPKLYDYFQENKFDLIHVATQGHIAFLALKVAHKFKLPKISSYHTAIPEYAHSRIINALGDNFIGKTIADQIAAICWYYQKRLYLSSKLILVPTKSVKKMIDREIGVPTDYFTRGVDSEAFSPAHRVASDQNRPATIFTGRISIEKNLKLIGKLDFSGGLEMTFIGDGPYVKTLRKLLPKAKFTGFLHGKQLHQAYASADIFVFPSKTDTFGNAVLEAMSSGLPVIVTDKMGPKDFVQHGETGFIATSDEEFIKYHSLLKEDSGLRKRIGQNARR